MQHALSWVITITHRLSLIWLTCRHFPWPFWLTYCQTAHLTSPDLHLQYAGIGVEIIQLETSTKIMFQNYSVGLAPVFVINNTSMAKFRFGQALVLRFRRLIIKSYFPSILVHSIHFPYIYLEPFTPNLFSDAVLTTNAHHYPTTFLINSWIATIHYPTSSLFLPIPSSDTSEKIVLNPGEQIYYTWLMPSSKREIIWSCGRELNFVDDLTKVYSRIPILCTV